MSDDRLDPHVYDHVLEYRVSVLPVDHDLMHTLSVAVRYIGHGWWRVVRHVHEYLDTDLEWSHVPQWPNGREPSTGQEIDTYNAIVEQWQAARRYPIGQAMDLAHRAAQALTLGGRPAIAFTGQPHVLSPAPQPSRQDGQGAPAERALAAVLSLCRTTDGEWLDGDEPIPNGEIARMIREAGFDPERFAAPPSSRQETPHGH